MPAAGSLLRFPDTPILSFSPEAIDSGSFTFRNWYTMRGIWISPEKVWQPEPEAEPDDLAITTDLLSGTFGRAEIPRLDKSAVLDPGSSPVDAGPSDRSFFLMGFAAFCAPLLLRVPRQRGSLH